MANMEKTRKFAFGKIDGYGNGRKTCLVTARVTVRIENGYPEFTASGKVWNSSGTDIIRGGQCLDSIKRVPVNNALFQEIKDLWHKYHLNGAHAGTVAQEDALKVARSKGLLGPSGYDYDKIVEYLKKVGLYEVNLTPTEKKYNPKYAKQPYKYGHGWLYHPIPANDLARINRIMTGKFPADDPAKKKTDKKVPTPRTVRRSHGVRTVL